MKTHTTYHPGRGRLYRYLIVILIFCLALCTYTDILGQRYSPKKRRNKKAVYSKSAFGLEVQSQVVYSQVDVPSLHSLDDVETDPGWRTGLGVSYRTSKLGLRSGIFFTKNQFNPKAEVNDITFRETGNLSYAGIYMRAEYTIRYFFLGGGVDITVLNKYSADRALISDGLVVRSMLNIEDESIAGKFRNISLIGFETGAKIPLGNISLKPYVSWQVSSGITDPEVVSVISSGPPFEVEYQTPKQIDLQFFPMVGFGLYLEYMISKS